MSCTLMGFLHHSTLARLCFPDSLLSSAEGIAQSVGSLVDQKMYMNFVTERRVRR
jgi:hypothetical protein